MSSSLPSVFARQWVKDVFSVIFKLSPSLYRQFYFFQSSFFIFLLCYGWSPQPTAVWDVQFTAIRYALYGKYWLSFLAVHARCELNVRSNSVHYMIQEYQTFKLCAWQIQSTKQVHSNSVHYIEYQNVQNSNSNSDSNSNQHIMIIHMYYSSCGANSTMAIYV